ncbi:LOW QUALITY PROTEIN: hypothetical protein BDA96_09G062700 [Sorghum bicolor]|uniref:PGG domain-containing protein n=2 Tax=Sorghum bicolor TaxID=4558 RepID=A0A921Q8C6_SORBI|nr:LOW QUALITY PROTEIN: hypothetical protein BDA96_09G062700 [Sorghum bicolor]KXG21416.1 LOW QUALITY PROTEIN: hypothetical protein SORBI_3009G059200 [Sorghum bicolor]
MAQEHRAVALLPTAVAGARAPQAGDGAESSHANSDMRQELQLLTVATLFVGMAFQAATQPPAWIPKDWLDTLLAKRALCCWRHYYQQRGSCDGARVPLLQHGHLLDGAHAGCAAAGDEGEIHARAHVLPPAEVSLAVAVSCNFAVAISCNFAVGISGDSRVLVIVFAIMGSWRCNVCLVRRALVG